MYTMTLHLSLSYSPSIIVKLARFAPKKLTTSNPHLSDSILGHCYSPVMNITSKSEPQKKFSTTFRVPDFNADELDSIAEDAFRRYTSSKTKRSGSGVSIVWFRYDLRLLDNDAFFQAWMSSAAVLPVYCVDPRHFGTTHYFRFPKTGALRARFLTECLADLKKSLMKRGLNLLVREGKPEEILKSIAEAVGAHTVYAHKETCSEEVMVEQLVSKSLQTVVLSQGGACNSKSKNPTLNLIWGSTMYHIDDLPFDVASLPDVYTQFRKSVESRCNIRNCHKLPMSLDPLPSKGVDEIGGWGTLPSLNQFDLHDPKIPCSVSP